MKSITSDLRSYFGASGRQYGFPPNMATARLHSNVGLERGSVSPRKVSSGGAVSCHNTRSRISSRSLVSFGARAVRLVRVYRTERPSLTAGELSESDRATRCPTEELRDGPYGAGCPSAFKPHRGMERRAGAHRFLGSGPAHPLAPLSGSAGPGTSGRWAFPFGGALCSGVSGLERTW
jgi:hypothetical protein